MAPASAAARRLSGGPGNLTDGDLEWTHRTSAAHLEGHPWPKQTTAVIQGSRARRTGILTRPWAEKPGALRSDDRRCHDDWTPRANRDWMHVTKHTRTAREG